MQARTNHPAMIHGIHLIVFPVKDVTAATALYAKFLGVEPYVSQPYYVGFRTGVLEVGLVPHGSQTSPICYWDVADIKKTLASLIDAGGKLHQAPKDVGAGKLIAAVQDIDGNEIWMREV